MSRTTGAADGAVFGVVAVVPVAVAARVCAGRRTGSPSPPPLV
ncbi:hypothetical protein [Streptomyces sp. NPDC093149]